MQEKTPDNDTESSEAAQGPQVKTHFPVSALFPPTYRLAVLCILIGVIGAGTALAFNYAVALVQTFLLEEIAGYIPPSAGILAPSSQLPGMIQRWWLPLVTTLGGLLSGLIVYTWAPEAEGHGTDAAIDAYHRRAGEVRGRIPFIKGIASALTIGSGGVAGREGPTAQISVGIGSILSKRLHLRGQQRRILLLASMSAGLAAIFRAPLGMAIFAVEILYGGMVFESEALIYTVISAVSAYAVHGFFVGWSPIFLIPSGLEFTHPMVLLGYVGLGVLAGVLASLLPAVFYGLRTFFRRLPGPPHLKPALGGLCVGLMGVMVPEILGTGYGWVQLAIAGKLSLGLLLILLIAKGPAMALTISSGGSGGVFAPTLVIGAMLGGVVGTGLNQVFPTLHVTPQAFVIAGMAAVFAATARAPLSTLIMVVEMTGGYALIVPVMLTNTLAFLIQGSLTGKRHYPSLYESQVASREDSPAHQGVFIRRAVEMLEEGLVDRADLTIPRLVSLLQFGAPIPVSKTGGLLVRCVIAAGSPLSGRTVAEGLGALTGTVVVTVMRGDEMIIPRGHTCLENGDEVIAVTDTSSYQKLLEAAGRQA